MISTPRGLLPEVAKNMTHIDVGVIPPNLPSPIYDAEVVIYRLEDAGAALLALPSRGCFPAGYRSNWPQVVVDAADAAELPDGTVKIPVPTARRVTQMDEAFGWVNLIPTDMVAHRRIVLMRALTSPRTGRNLWTWRKIGTLLGMDYRSVERWHAAAIGKITAALFAQQISGAAWAVRWHAERDVPGSLAPRADAELDSDLGKGLRTTRW